MFAPIRAKAAAAVTVAPKPAATSHGCNRVRICATVALACGLAGCMPATAPLAGADPADAAAKVAPTGYRSTIAPYTSLRPAEPGPWLDQNRRVAPAPKSEQ